MKMFLGAVAALAVASSGCSIAFQSHLGDGAMARRDAPCSASGVLPWVDVGFVAAEVAAAGAGIAIANGTGGVSNRDEVGPAIAGVALVAAVIQGASAGNGFRRASACERAHAGAAMALR